MSDYFVDFAPADAVQYDGTNHVEVLRFAGASVGEPIDTASQLWPVAVWEHTGARPGQWLVRQGDKVWVQDEEPARVERWELGSPDAMDVFQARVMTHRRPIVRTPDGSLWTGPWMPVEGGAE